MAPTKIPTGTSQYDVMNDARTYLLDTGDSLTVSDAHGIFVADDFHDDTIIVKGSIDQTGSGFAGIWADGLDTTIRVADGGSIIGDVGIGSESPDPTSKLRIFNDGDIATHGDYAIFTQDSREIVVNHGTITGRISLGSGDDKFDNRGGTVDHKIEGGTGDDTLVTDDAGVKLKEDGGSAGFDTVRSSVSYTLSANVEQLILIGSGNINGKGTADGNTLQGNSGDNKLFGIDGSGSDTFNFKTGGGHDTLMDFDSGIDKIAVADWDGMGSFADIKKHATDVGSDVHITLGDDTLIIKDTHKADLHSGDFVFDF